MKLDFGRFGIWELDTPRVMGVLNVTPDSFSDGGLYADPGHAVEHALRMIEEGADIIDVGGESTRPGAEPVSVSEELARIMPVVERLAGAIKVPLSIDTSKPDVMRAAVEAGAAMINDVYALRTPGALEVAATLGVPVCLMHMQGEPRTMQREPRYGNVVSEVKEFLLARAAAAQEAGIPSNRIVLDPGFGFGKTLGHNYELLRNTAAFAACPYPLLIGVSRKSMIGAVLGGVPPAARVHGSVAAAVIAVWQGAHIVRTHDVRATRDALRVCAAARAGLGARAAG